MEKASILKNQLENSNLMLGKIYKQQKEMITDYIKEKGKIFVADLPKDENGNYILPENVSSVNDLNYVYIGGILTNHNGEDTCQWVKAIGFEYNKEYDEINVFYCDETDDTEILCCDFIYFFETSYMDIINKLIECDN